MGLGAPSALDGFLQAGAEQRSSSQLLLTFLWNDEVRCCAERSGPKFHERIRSTDLRQSPFAATLECRRHGVIRFISVLNFHIFKSIQYINIYIYIYVYIYIIYIYILYSDMFNICIRFCLHRNQSEFSIQTV